MKATKGVVDQALEFERIQAAASRIDKERALNKRLYAIPGVEGIFRRVARSGTGLAIKRENARLATFDGTIIELIRDQAAENEIREAGFVHLGTGARIDVDGKPVADPQLTRIRPGVYPVDVPDQAQARVEVSEEEGRTIREAGMMAVKILPAKETTPPPEADGEGLTAAEILEEQRRQANP